MALELGCRRERIPQESTELPFALLAATFHNVGLDRHRRTNHLTAEGRVRRPANTSGNAVSVQSQSARVLPHLKLLEVGHRSKCDQCCPAQPSFHCTLPTFISWPNAACPDNRFILVELAADRG